MTIIDVLSSGLQPKLRSRNGRPPSLRMNGGAIVSGVMLTRWKTPYLQHDGSVPEKPELTSGKVVVRPAVALPAQAARTDLFA